MGASTKLNINPRYHAEDIIEIMENRMGITDCKIHQTQSSSYCVVTFTGPVNGEPRSMNVHLCTTDESENMTTSLSLGARGEEWQSEAVRIFTEIAKVVGGTLVPNDCESGSDMFIPGMVGDNDGLPFHVRNAIRKGHMRDNKDLIGLLWSLRAWTCSSHGQDIQDILGKVESILNTRNK